LIDFVDFGDLYFFRGVVFLLKNNHARKGVDAVSEKSYLVMANFGNGVGIVN